MPKFEMAEPKNTGVCLPVKNSSKAKGVVVSRINSTSSRIWATTSSPKTVLNSGLSTPSITISSPISEFFPASYKYILSSNKCTTPLNDLPIPIGQVIGAHSIFSTVSTSSNKSIGVLPSLSNLLIKVKIGVSRNRHTSINLIVRISTPLATSITIKAESTAVKVR